MIEKELFELLDPEHHGVVRGWLERGDGVAIYQNMALDSSRVGHRQYVSFGSPRAQLEVDEPPKRLPDIGNQINWPYQLVDTIRRGQSSKC